MTNYHFLWLDLETTGLSSSDDHILEVGWSVSEPKLDFLHPLIQSRLITPRAEVTRLLQESPEAYSMHEKSGLLIDLYQDGTVVLEDAEDDILNSLPEGQVVLAGSSVHFDRAFIERYMPRLHERLHYRHFDVSAVRMLMESIGITLHTAENKKPHRVEYDIDWAMNYAYTAQATIRGAWDISLATLKGDN